MSHFFPTYYGSCTETPDRVATPQVVITPRDSSATTSPGRDTLASVPATQQPIAGNDSLANQPAAQAADTIGTGTQPLHQPDGDTTAQTPVSPLPADTLPVATPTHGMAGDSTSAPATSQSVTGNESLTRQPAAQATDTIGTGTQTLHQPVGDTTAQTPVTPRPTDTLPVATPTHGMAGDSTSAPATSQPVTGNDSLTNQPAAQATDTTGTHPLSQPDGDTTAQTTVAPLWADTTQAPIDTTATVIDTTARQTYIPSIPIREGLPGTERAGNAPFHDDSFFALLLTGLVVFLLFIRYRKKILSWQADGNAKHHRDSNRSKHLIGINASLRNLFLAYTFLIEGCLGAITFFVVDMPLPFSGGYAINALLLALPAALYFLLQQGIFVLLASTFSSDARGREWYDTHLIINLLLGIGFYPFVFVAIYLPETAQTALLCAAALYLLSRILFIIKGVKLFLRDFRCLLYFILYLCALEIAPLLLVCKSWGLL